MKKKGFVVLAVAAVLTLGTATMSAWADGRSPEAPGHTMIPTDIK